MITSANFTRLYRIFAIAIRYRLLLPFANNRHIYRLLWIGRCCFWLRPIDHKKSYGERLRLAFEQLGPIWVKFGQLLSTRHDLIPLPVIEQLKLLQDHTTPIAGDIIRLQIEKSLVGSIETWFDQFDEQALASASIAQVHSAILKSNQQPIVIKVLRPDIYQSTHADLRLMYHIARQLPKWTMDGHRLHADEIVHEYEKTLLAEFDLRIEAANGQKLKQNFHHSEWLYVPRIYHEYSRSNLLVMERIRGINIADYQGLVDHGVDLKCLAERGVNLFFTQVFRDSFFHADMHPGNIFVNVDNPKSPQYIAIDFGIVGTLSDENKRYLAENFLAFFNHDYRKVAQLHIDSGWVAPDTDIDAFTLAIQQVCEPMIEKPLAEISFGQLLFNLFAAARQFKMEVQPQLVLLEKTLLYIEGLGRQLYPQLDLWATAKPFLEKWLQQQVSWQTVASRVYKRLPYWPELLPELPEAIYYSFKLQKKLNLSMQNLQQQLNQQHNQQQQRYRTYYLLIIGTIFFLSALWFYNSQSMMLSASFSVMAIVIWGIGWKQMA